MLNILKIVMLAYCLVFIFMLEVLMPNIQKLAFPGMVYGTLTVLEEAEPYLCTRASGHISKSRRVKCRCICGKELIVAANDLPNSFKKGCNQCRDYSGAAHKGFGGVGTLSKSKWSTIYYGAIRRGIAVELTISEAWEIFKQQDGKCALTGIPITLEAQLTKLTESTASLDRIDSSGPYSIQNCQWVHKDINVMKQSHSVSEFIEWCRKVCFYNLETIAELPD